jgi:hypothetical protein
MRSDDAAADYYIVDTKKAVGLQVMTVSELPAPSPDRRDLWKTCHATR